MIKTKSSSLCAFALLLLGGASWSACSNDDGTNPNPTTTFGGASSDGFGGTSAAGTAGSAGTGGAAGASAAAGSSASSLRPFTAPADPGGGGILFSASGETLALSGFPFPPGDPANDTYMVDGWNFQLAEYITVFDHITLWDNPDVVPTDQSQHGAVVAHVDGPWVVDLHKGGPLAGKGGGGEEATPIAALSALDSGSSFDTTVTYGFGFSTVAPTGHEINVNLDASEMGDFEYMVQHGYSVLYVGTATWAGAGSSCTQSDSMEPAAKQYNFSNPALPQTIPFRLGFSTPTNYVNCQNGTDLAGPGVNGEDHPRGVQFSSSTSIIAQVTIHMDHPFWESFAENSPLHWDNIAGQYLSATGPVLAHTEDLIGVPFAPFVDKSGAQIPWRNCAGSNYTPPSGEYMTYDTLNVPVDPSETDPTKAIRDYYDFIRYSQSTQGHLNSQGLCYIARQYPAPGGGS